MADNGERQRVTRSVSTLLPNGERRRRDRRSRQRRQQVARVVVERRALGDRRLALQRRESARGHLFNAAQLLTLAAADAAAADELMRSALRRVWLALRELELGNVGGMGAAAGRDSS